MPWRGDTRDEFVSDWEKAKERHSFTVLCPVPLYLCCECVRYFKIVFYIVKILACLEWIIKSRQVYVF